MTDKARELLERACDVWDEANYSHTEMHVVFNAIRAYLAEPEVKRERLSDAFIYQVGNKRVIAEFNDEFHAGVRFAEWRHGIGGGDE